MPNVSWCTEDLREGKHNRRKAERLWWKTKLEIHHQLYQEICREVVKLLMRSKSSFSLDKYLRLPLKKRYGILSLSLSQNIVQGSAFFQKSQYYTTAEEAKSG